MATIKKMHRMSDGAQIYPQTHTKAVIDDNGYTAESRLQAMQDEINQAQLEIGAVPSDLTPTENSTNWVTSGGVFNATNIGDANVEIDLSDYTEVNGFINSSAKWYTSYKGKFIPVAEHQNYRIVAHASSISYYAFMTSNTVGSNNSNVTTFASGWSARAQLATNEVIIVKSPYNANYLWVATSGTTQDSMTPQKVEIYNKSTIAEVVNELVEDLQPKLSTKRFQLSIGTLSTATGLYPTKIIYYIGRSHTPRYIKNRGPITIKTLGLVANVLLYSENFTYLESSSSLVVDTTDGEVTVSLPSDAEYFRLGITSQLVSIEIEGYWTGDDEAFQPRPSNGYQPFTFEVHPIRCNGSEDSSSLRSQYEITTDSCMLHLPSSYKETGQPTPLIIFIHGSVNNYTSTSTSFPTAVPLAPEWDAAGFAQMDVDLIPDLYNDKQDNTSGGSSDDAECIIGAYKWCIEHFNIRRDGVYLIGRSRGGQAVLQTLGRYNPSEMPIIAAINNAGANAIINYGIINSSASALWNLLCESFNLPTEGRPTASGSNALIRQDDIYNFLAANIDMWWKKASVGALLMTDNKSEYQTPSEILQFLHEHGVSSNEYLGFLEQLRFRSPVPLRFDWCVADTVQTWNANNGRGNYSRIMKDDFVKNLSGNAEYREWPTADSTTPSVSGASDRGHYHELYNIYNGDYTLPNGAVVTNPSMARVEWLLWCMSHDNRF